ncbi:MAG: hypothetical protein ACOZNI_10630 [Myxococcota bacterium]
MGLLFVALAHAAPVTLEAALEQAATVSPQEADVFAGGAIEEIAGAVRTVQKLLAEARKAGDADAVECLTRKLVPLEALHGVALDARAALARADHADAELRKVAVALSRSRAFLAEAHACVAGAAASPGESRVSLAGEPVEGPVLADVGAAGPDEVRCEPLGTSVVVPQASPSGWGGGEASSWETWICL